MKIAKIEELEIVAIKVAEWIAKNGDPYMSVVITDDQVIVNQTMHGIPVKRDDHF